MRVRKERVGRGWKLLPYNAGIFFIFITVAAALPVDVVIHCIPPHPKRSAGPVSYFRIDRQGRVNEILKGKDLGPPQMLSQDTFLENQYDGPPSLYRLTDGKVIPKSLPNPPPVGMLHCLYANGDWLLSGDKKYYRYSPKNGKTTLLDIYEQYQRLKEEAEKTGLFEVTCIPGKALILRTGILGMRSREVAGRFYIYDLPSKKLKPLWYEKQGEELLGCYNPPYSPGIERLAICGHTYVDKYFRWLHLVLLDARTKEKVWELSRHKPIPTFSLTGRWTVAMPLEEPDSLLSPVEPSGYWAYPPTTRLILVDLKTTKTYPIPTPQNPPMYCQLGASVLEK